MGWLRRGSKQAAPAGPDRRLDRAIGDLLSAGKPTAALSILDRAVAARPRDVAAHSHRAAALLDLGQYELALDAVRHALQIQPGFTAALEQRARVLERLRDATEAGLAVGERALEGSATADDAMWGPVLALFETRIHHWTENRPAAIALWIGGQAAAQTMLDERLEARLYRRSASRAILEEFHHAFARRMVVRFGRLASEHGTALDREQLDEWLLLLDEACGARTSRSALLETHLLDLQYEHARSVPDDSATGTGAHNLEPAITLAIAHWILGPTDRPNIPRGSLPANSVDQFIRRGGSGLPHDQQDLALAHHALSVGEEALRRTFIALLADEGESPEPAEPRTDPYADPALDADGELDAA